MDDIFGADKVLKKCGLNGFGLCDSELKLPLVLILCEQGCREEAEQIRLGVMNGGLAGAIFELPILSELAADGAGKGSVLYAREAIADLTEAMLCMYSADGCAIVASGITAAAGMLMGALRHNTPVAFLPSFLRGEFYPSRLGTLRAAVLLGSAGIGELESAAADFSASRSVEIGGINGFCLFLEGCGLAVKNSVGAWSISEKIERARECGLLAAKRTTGFLTPRKELDRNSFVAGLAAFISCGGRAADVIHILALAAEVGLDFDFGDVETLSERVPRLAIIAPFLDGFSAGSLALAQSANATDLMLGSRGGLRGSNSDFESSGSYNIVDFVRSGGVFAVLKELLALPKLLSDCTICGKKLSGQTEKITGGSIMPLTSPISAGGFSVLRGSLFDFGVAARGISGIFKGAAVVFDSEDAFRAAIFGGNIAGGSVAIVRGSGVRERGLPILDLTSAVRAACLDILVITDGRVGYGGCGVISMCSGGALTAVKNGDLIEVDFKKGKATLNAPTKEINARLKKVRDDGGSLAGGLVRYSALVGDANEGCVLRKKF